MPQTVVKLGGAWGSRTPDRRIKRARCDNDLARCSARRLGSRGCFLSAHALTNSGPLRPVSDFHFATAMVRPARSIPPGKPAQVTQPSGWPRTCLRQWRARLSRVPLAARTARTHRDSCRVAPGGQGINDVASAGVCIPEADPRRTRPDTRSAGRVESRHSESRPSGRGVFPRPGPASSAHSTTGSPA
jgi:hypothetical protein